MGHIRLSRENDLILVAPASANIIAHAAAGITNDLATTVLLASNKPIYFAPSMNVEMWNNPITRKNVLSQLGGVENLIFIAINGEKVFATPEGDTERTDAYGKTSSVHFLHFHMNEDQINNFKKSDTKVELGTDHKEYLHTTVMSSETRLSLIEDLD